VNYGTIAKPTLDATFDNEFGESFPRYKEYSPAFVLILDYDYDETEVWWLHNHSFRVVSVED